MMTRGGGLAANVGFLLALLVSLLARRVRVQPARARVRHGMGPGWPARSCWSGSGSPTLQLPGRAPLTGKVSDMSPVSLVVIGAGERGTGYARCGRYGG
jgi:hypothetical protein